MQAIEIIKNSKKTHEDWLAYFMEFPDQEKTEEYKHLGDRFFHEKCISDYEKVIKKIEQLQADNEEMADMLIAGSFLGRGTQLIGDMRYQELLKAEAENKDLKDARKKPEPTEFTKIRRSKRDAEIEEANRFYDENIALLRKNDIEERYRWDMKACEIIDSLTAENEAFKREKAIWIQTHNTNVERIHQLKSELAEARKKPEPTDEGCTNCKNLLEAEITRQAAELAQLKRALRYPEPDDSERQYMFCGYCGKEGAMTIDELQQHILSCEKHPIFKLQAELEAKDKEIDRLKRVIELDEQIEQALKK